ncbi:RteC domain-containing protein [Maribacter sp. 2-571]|uniref:RteC domain-containing protein n=1 Tax=Maribacter sp. 2-571 TaxID=3417569 RepID=UPI003D33AB62
MAEELTKIVTAYNQNVAKVEFDFDNDFKLLEVAIKSTREYLQKLRIRLRKATFKTPLQEINFFKNQKPMVFGRLKFYTRVYSYFLEKPQGSKAKQRKHIDVEIEKLQNSQGSYFDFIQYYREGATLLDEHYFTRGKHNTPLLSNNCHFFADSEFTTGYDVVVADILAYDLMIHFFNRELQQLNETKVDVPTFDFLVNGERLGWTASKTDLIELIYALQTCGAIKSGTAGIKEMASACELVFDIDLGNYYRTFLEIRERKIDQTKFLDRLKDNLLKRMKDIDG